MMLDGLFVMLIGGGDVQLSIVGVLLVIEIKNLIKSE